LRGRERVTRPPPPPLPLHPPAPRLLPPFQERGAHRAGEGDHRAGPRRRVFYWGQLMAAAMLGSIPVAVIYSFFVDYYVARLTAGSG